MNDYKDILLKYKNNLIESGYEDNSDIDTIDIIEEANARITDDSKKYRESDKCIFKQEISYESAKRLVTAVQRYQEYDKYNLNEYKDEIYQEVLFCFEKGENPIEMLVYSIRQLSDKIYIHAILDLVKDLINDYRGEIVKAFENILINWIWEDCIEFVLNSIGQNFLQELEKEVYKLFTKNYKLRIKAANTLINIEAKETFVSMVNYLVVNTTESRDDTGMMKDIMYRLGNDSEFGSRAIYKVYLQVQTRNVIRKLLMLGIRRNLTGEIYADIEKKLKNNQIKRHVHNQLLELLSYTDKNQKSQELLKMCTDYRYIDKKKLNDILMDNIGELIEVTLNEKADIETRKNAIIKIVRAEGRSKEEKIEIVRKLYDKSDSLRIISASALTQLGERNELMILFKYLVGSSDDGLVNEALNQIRRLKSIQDTNVNNALSTVIGRIMENDEASNTVRVLRMLDIYKTGLPNGEISEVFLKKLASTKHQKIKVNLLEFFAKNYSILPNSEKEKIREEITRLTHDKSVAEIAMETLKKINIASSNLPVSIC